MTSTRKADVVEAAGRLFAEHGYEGTSMRDLGRELGMLGSSLYAHVGSKQDLLVEVVERGAGLFEASVERAADGPTGRDRLRELIAGHVDVVLDHRDEVRTFLNEARSLDPEHRTRVLDARNRYEAAFRAAFKQGVGDGSIAEDTDEVLAAIFLLSILNALDRWYSEQGRIDRSGLVDEILRFAARSTQY